MENRKKRHGDRSDGYLVRNIDAMHVFMPHLLPKRTDNEAVMKHRFEMSEIMKYVEKKNEGNPEYPYTMFHVICAAFAKTIAMRPKLNRFIAGDRLYDRKEISFSFVAKNKFADNSDESVIIVRVDTDSKVSPVDQIHEQVCKEVYKVRHENHTDGTTDFMNGFAKLPRFILKFITKMLFWMDYHDKLPKSIADVDPYRSTVFISNIGSIKMSADYHHLANWSTNSFFVIVGEKKLTPFFNEDGTFEMRDSLDMGMTIDERIADGFYFSKSVKLLEYIINNPFVLDLPLTTPVSYEVK